MDAVADRNPPPWLVESLERSDAQITGGETAPPEPVLGRLRASIAHSPEAEAHVDRLIVRYEAKEPLQAARTLFDALERAKQRIALKPEAALRATAPKGGATGENGVGGETYDNPPSILRPSPAPS